VDRRTRQLLIERLNRDGEQIAGHFGLVYKAIVAERANVRSRYGACYEDGTIKIRLCHAVTRKPLKYSSLVNTLCHELAHLRYFHHGDRFKLFYQQILSYARAQRLYRPRTLAASAARTNAAPQTPSKQQAPVQLGLF